MPRFADFPVTPIFPGSPGRPRFTSPPHLHPGRDIREGDLPPDADDRYRSSVEYDAKHGPNFAGHYTIALWSCGTGCSSMVVVDAKTGTLYRDVPFGTLDINGNPAAKNHEYAGLRFRIDSSLLIVEGCRDADFRRAKGERPDCSRSYFQWMVPGFKFLRKIPLSPPTWLLP